MVYSFTYKGASWVTFNCLSLVFSDEEVNNKQSQLLISELSSDLSVNCL